MKILTVSILLLLALTIVIFVSSDEPVEPPSRKEETTVTTSERKTNSKIRNLSHDEMILDFPYAKERLGILYKKYPNLRPSEFKPADGPTIIDELDRLVAETGDDLKIPREFNRQKIKTEEWHQEVIGNYLTEKKDVLGALLNLSELSTGESTFRYSDFDDSSSRMNVWRVRDFLGLAMDHAMRSGDEAKAAQIINALERIGEAGSKPFLADSLIGDAVHQSVQRSLGELAQAEFDVSGHIEKLAAPSSTKVILESLRREVIGTVSLLEAFKKGDQENINGFFTALSGNLPSDEQEKGSEEKLLLEELADLDIDDFQDDFAMIVSRFMEALPEAPAEVSLGDPVLSDFEFKILEQGVSESRALLLEPFLASMLKGASRQPVRAEHSRRELITHSAMQQAAAAGVTVNELADLVPDFLPEVPVNPKTGEPFMIDPEKGGVDFGPKG